MKSVVFLVLFFSFGLRAELAERALQISEALTEVEYDLHPAEYDVIQRNLKRIELILNVDVRPPRSPQFICVSNGDSGGFEKFGVYYDGKVIGGYTKAEFCNKVVAGSQSGLICLSNGDSGVFEKFTPYQLKEGNKMGGQTSLQTCLDLVSAATRHFVCVSNGDSGVFQKFRLVDRSRNVSVGGWTSYQNCISSLPRQ